MASNIHLVGSIPLADATEVFNAVTELLGDRFRRLPDGETGPRTEWINSLEEVFQGNPAFTRSDETYARRGTAGTDKWYRYTLKPTVPVEEVSFDDQMPQAREAIVNYELFAQLKQAGVIPASVRYQVQLTPASSVIRRWVVERFQADLEAAYDDALLSQVRRMVEVIPADQLAVSWDVASSVFERLEAGEPTRYGSTVEEMIDTFGARAIRLGEGVPEGVELLYHLCYGDAQHRHTIEPKSSAILVDFANHLAAGIGRQIDLIHMPVPRDRDDDSYYEPLSGLALQPGSEVALGLVHYTDGVEGSLRRATVAKKYLPAFAIGTECGFGRRDPATIRPLLEIHAAVADRLAEIGVGSPSAA